MIKIENQHSGFEKEAAHLFFLKRPEMDRTENNKKVQIEQCPRFPLRTNRGGQER